MISLAAKLSHDCSAHSLAYIIGTELGRMRLVAHVRSDPKQDHELPTLVLTIVSQHRSILVNSRLPRLQL